MAPATELLRQTLGRVTTPVIRATATATSLLRQHGYEQAIWEICLPPLEPKQCYNSMVKTKHFERYVYRHWRQNTVTAARLRTNTKRDTSPATGAKRRLLRHHSYDQTL